MIPNRRRQRHKSTLQKSVAAQIAEATNFSDNLSFAKDRMLESEARLRERLSHEAAHDRELATLRDRVMELTRTLGVRNEELQAIKTNLGRHFLAAFWRRSVRQSWVAKQIKRLVKLIWWTVTLQLPSAIRRVVRDRRSAQLISASGLFRPAWYLARYPDVSDAGLDSLAHYIRYGASEGRDPDPLFDNDWYLEQNPDVRTANINPLAHYLLHGAREGRDPNPLFDTDWYLHQNPDVRDAGVNPLVHYAHYGASEGRDPSRKFNSSWYLAANQDVLASGENPLMHYLEFGKKGGRQLSVHQLGVTSNLERRQLPASYDVVILANIDWRARHQRPQQLATQFARDGHYVFYIVASPTLPSDSSGAYAAEPVADNILQLQFSQRCFFDRYATSLDEPALGNFLSAIDDVVDDFRIVDAVVHVHLPSWSRLAIALREKWLWPVVYDCMDHWDGFPGLGRDVVAADRALVIAADLVTVTGSLLERNWRALARRCKIVRNGVDFQFFQNHCVSNTRFAFSKPVIGYYGALADWIDLDLIAELAARNPQWHFVLAGDIFVSDLRNLDAMRNVTLLGLRPYEDMPPLLWHFDVCLIPFKLNEITHAVDPVKLYEYLSSGKPIVSAPLDELEIYSDVVAFANGPAAFSRAIANALAEDDPGRAVARREVAAQNQWSGRYASLQAEIRQLYPRVSIIIVAHNAVAVTQLCIDSIIANTTHPCYEIIIVDNASSDETQDFLASVQAGNPNVRTIFNDRNLGFAAANNQGLRLAQGEIIVLMNNDVVVPRGWLHGMLRCLKDPNIGLVGPVTNTVGNEARIEVDYRDLSDMDPFAHAYMRTHAGQFFDIAMLAMYCLAMRSDTFSKIGFLDEGFGLGMFEDDDYANRARAAGYRVVCTEESYVHHFGQASFKKLIDSGEYDAVWERNKAYYESKWGLWKPHVLRGRPSQGQR